MYFLANKLKSKNLRLKSELDSKTALETNNKYDRNGFAINNTIWKNNTH